MSFWFYSELVIISAILAPHLHTQLKADCATLRSHFHSATINHVQAFSFSGLTLLSVRSASILCEKGQHTLHRLLKSTVNPKALFCIINIRQRLYNGGNSEPAQINFSCVELALFFPRKTESAGLCEPSVNAPQRVLLETTTIPPGLSRLGTSQYSLTYHVSTYRY